ncbi:unnamed protein product [marine sediment metagenome]|uniref:Uncharacterized protein n=1 Tax=marine sediment metagenome TaxID=412755 RepID=X1LD19_9ZZZZ
MRFLLALAALTLSAQTSAAPPDYYELHKCIGKDGFAYWTVPPCAAGDSRLARDSNVDSRKPLAEQIRSAECRFAARLPMTHARKPNFENAERVPSIEHCQ